jgi:hypothetical protein
MKPNKLSKKEANQQIRRMEHFYGAPKSDGGWLDAVDALMRYSRDFDHCRAVIDAYVDSPRQDEQGNPKFPSVFDIRLLCEKGRQKRPVCVECNGDGFLPDTPAFSQGVRYERVKRCSCNTQATSADRQGWTPGDITTEAWFIPDLASSPDMIAKWKRLSTATRNSAGYLVTDGQRQFANGIIRRLEDHMGTAV